MKISTKGRYALRLMLDFALHGEEGAVSLSSAAQRQGISKKYLEQIVSPLHKAGLVDTVRGQTGGYSLSRAPEDYTVGEILRITEGDMSPVACLHADDTVACERADDCMTLYLWRGLSHVITNYLDSVTLQDLIDHAEQG